MKLELDKTEELVLMLQLLAEIRERCKLIRDNKKYNFNTSSEVIITRTLVRIFDKLATEIKFLSEESTLNLLRKYVH